MAASRPGATPRERALLAGVVVLYALAVLTDVVEQLNSPSVPTPAGPWGGRR